MGMESMSNVTYYLIKRHQLVEDSMVFGDIYPTKYMGNCKYVWEVEISAASKLAILSQTLCCS